MGFVVQGLNTVIVSLAKASVDVKRGAADRMEKVLTNIDQTAASLAPRDTGATAESIDHEVTQGFGSVTGESGPHTRQAPFMEWGTYKDAPQAFMGPALDRHSHELEEGLADLGEI